MRGVSFLIVTLNAQRSLARCLDCLAVQDYPKNRYEVLLLDGGSTDLTLEIARRFVRKMRVRIIDAGLKDNQEARRRQGFLMAKFDYVCVLDADNYLLDKDWIKKLVAPLEENPQVVGSFTLHYYYDPHSSLFNRYLALIGGTDPVVYYLGKNDRAKWVARVWPKKNQIVKSTPGYWLVKFNKNNFPTLGSNGSIIRKNLVDAERLSDEDFFHTDILYDLIDKGYDTYAVVDRKVLHDTSSNFLNQLSRRYRYMSLHHLKLLSKRRYKIFDTSKASDVVKLCWYLVISLTFIWPTVEAVWGYFRQRDRAWLMHPIYCFIYTLAYGLAVISHKVSYNSLFQTEFWTWQKK